MVAAPNAPAASATGAANSAADHSEAAEAPKQTAATTPTVSVIPQAPLGVLSYALPESLHDQPPPAGTPVTVPLGTRSITAYVVANSTETQNATPGAATATDLAATPSDLILRELESIDLSRPNIPVELLKLALFASRYYRVPAGDMLSAMLPTQAKPAPPRYRLTPAGKGHDPGFVPTPLVPLFDEAQAKHPRPLSLNGLQKSLGWNATVARRRLQAAIKEGWLEQFHKAPPKPRKPKTANGQDDANGAPKTDPHTLQHLSPAPTTLTGDQTEVVNTIKAAIAQKAFAPFLLQGVTGSGKTEVYLQAIAAVLNQTQPDGLNNQGNQSNQHNQSPQTSALMLVPEIALTPQLASRFRQRFGDDVATFHSGLTPAERRDEWERVRKGQARIGLGARSALFLPLANLGIIVVDEEHEASFKQDENPRYNGRDLALVRAHQAGIPIILGSATPSLETLHNATTNRYGHLHLRKRVHDKALPHGQGIDLANTPRVGENIFTQPLASAIERTLSAGEQVMLFLNRRGFSSYVYCQDCGLAYRCDDCDVALTLHQKRGALVCHYCGTTHNIPNICDDCQSHRVRASGLGTERVQEEVKNLLGNKIRTDRLDRDTAGSRKKIHDILTRFASGDTQILIGTQMLAKGHDFHNVTLVGVIEADTGLNFPDFRASERTFQRLTQVAGRAGRGDKKGHVLIQAYDLKHHAISHALDHNYSAFMDIETANRKELGYPPYAQLTLVRFEGKNEHTTIQQAQQAAEALNHACTSHSLQVHILGPAPAPLARLRGLWRQQIMLKSPKRQDIHQALNALPRITSSTNVHRGGVRCCVDVDPMNML